MQNLRYSVYMRPLIILVDLVFMLGIFSYFYFQFYDFKLQNHYLPQFSILVLLVGLFWILLGSQTNIYNIPRNLSLNLFLERHFIHCLTFSLGVILLVKASKIDFLLYNRLQISCTLIISSLVVKSLILFTLRYFRSKGFNNRNVMFLGDNRSLDLLKQNISEVKYYGFRIFEFNQDEVSLQKLKDFWQGNGIYSVFLSTDTNYNSLTRQQIIEAAELYKVRVVLVPDSFNDTFYKYKLDYIESQPVLFPSVYPLDYSGNYLLKRFFDIIISGIFLAFVGVWMFPIIAILIKINSKGPVFFLQKRYGYREQIFYCIKFRTMTVNPYANTKVTSENDQRITKVGAVLRKHNIDELPQFINVFLGQMSIVGPRPHMLLVDDFYKSKLKKYAVRSSIKPGITGLAQVKGLRGDSGNMEVEMQKRVLADAYYVKNWSLSMDILIILKTCALSIFGSNKSNH